MNELQPDFEITFDHSIKTRFGYLVIKEFGVLMMVLGFILGLIISETDFQPRLVNKPNTEHPSIR